MAARVFLALILLIAQTGLAIPARAAFLNTPGVPACCAGHCCCGDGCECSLRPIPGDPSPQPPLPPRATPRVELLFSTHSAVVIVIESSPTGRHMLDGRGARRGLHPGIRTQAILGSWII